MSDTGDTSDTSTVEIDGFTFTTKGNRLVSIGDVHWKGHDEVQKFADRFGLNSEHWDDFWDKFDRKRETALRKAEDKYWDAAMKKFKEME